MTRLTQIQAWKVLTRRSGGKSGSHSLLLVIAILVNAFLFPVLVCGQTDVWLGGTGNWSDASKWSAGVPASTSNVFVDNGNSVASAVTVDVNDSVNNLIVDSDDSLIIRPGITLTVNGNSTNSGTIWTQEGIRCSGGQLAVPGTIMNKGGFIVSPGSAISVTGTLSNFSGTTLSGGTYSVFSGYYMGRPCYGTFSFTGANIVTNAARIRLSGPYSRISGLGSLASTTSKGSLALQGSNLTTPGSYTNAGKLSVGPGTKFTVNGSYTQTAGTTTVNGNLTAPGGVTVQAGNVFGNGTSGFGNGTIAASVVSSGSVTAGDSPTRPGTLSPSTYTQNSNGSLNIAIGGLTAGTQYGQLTVPNGVGLDGVLNITLVNGFVPAIGKTFTILTASARSGKFSTVNGLSINSGEHFTIAYNPTNVILTVVSGP